MPLWLVRAGSRGEWEEVALRSGLAIIGWSELPDLSTFNTREELQHVLMETYPDIKSNAVPNWAGQIWSFVHGIHQGDIVVLPLKNRPFVVFGEVTGPYAYRTDLPGGLRHARPVKWLQEIPRSNLDQDLLYSLGAYMTVCRIQRNNAEQRVRALLTGNTPLKPMPAGDTADGADDWQAPPDIEQYARDQIRNHIARRFKGHNLTHLVAAVLEAQGYKVRVSPEGADGGVDIVAGYGPLGFDRPRLVVQVKSGDDPVDVKVIRELQGAMKSFGAEHGLIVAWAGYKASVMREASRLFFEVRLWDADALIRAIQDHYERLPDSLQAELPLKRVWVLVPSEE